MRAGARPLLAIVAMLGTACDPAPEPLAAPQDGPVLVHSASRPTIDFELPEFQLVDQRGRPFTRADLLGKVWITDFIFTSCPTVCPRLTTELASVARTWKGEANLRFLSISVDPENDTPALLAAFAGKYDVDPERWLFVTGEPAVVKSTVLQGFKMALGRGGDGNLFHAERFVVVDKRARVRGVYDADADGIVELQARVKILLAE